MSITTFKNDEFELLVTHDSDGVPHFNVNELCAALEIANAHDAVARHVDPDDLGKREVIDSVGRKQMANFVNESGMYALILGSTKPAAKRFKRWVTSEVLPSIRKTGSYIAPNAIGPLKATAEAAKAFPALARVARMLGCDKNAAAIAANQAIYGLTNINLMKQLGTTHLEAEKQDTLWFTPTELGQRFHNTSARGMNLLLAEAGLQAKINDKWEPTQVGREFCRLFDTSKKHGSGVPVMQVKWSINVLPMLGESKEAA